MQTVQTDIRISQYERQLAATTEENRKMAERLAALERTNRLAIYERDLTGLLGQGYQFVLADEMKDCGDMTADQFAKHCERIKRNYQRGPVGSRMLQAYSGPVEAGKAATEKDEIPIYTDVPTEEFENAAFEKRLDYIRQQSRAKYEKISGIASADDGPNAWDDAEQEFAKRKMNGQAKKTA